MEFLILICELALLGLAYAILLSLILFILNYLNQKNK